MARPWNAMLIAADRRSSMVSSSAVACGPSRRGRRAQPAHAPMQETYFGGFCSFHGSLTLGIVSNSTLASLPSFISVLRILMFWTMSRVAGSIEIEPRGLLAVFQLVRNLIASSPVNLPLVSLIRSNTADMPSQPCADRKSGVALPAYSLFQAARKALLAGRSAAAE